MPLSDRIAHSFYFLYLLFSSVAVMNVLYMSVVSVKWEGTEGMVQWLTRVFHKVPYQQGHSMYPRASLVLCSSAQFGVSSVTQILLFLVALTCHGLPHQVLQNLGKDQYPQQSLEQIGTRIAKVLEKVSHPVAKLETTAHLLTFPDYLPLHGLTPSVSYPALSS